MSDLLFGLAGPARSGKDTVANFLETLFGFHCFALAEPIKQGVGAAFGLSDAQLHGDLKELVIDELGVSPRFLMQTFGTDWARKMIADDVWLRVMSLRLASARDAFLADLVLSGLDETDLPCGVPFNSVITDVRFENEASWIRARGGVIVHIQRPNFPVVLAHESEAGVCVKPGDFVLRNDGTFDLLRKKVDDLVLSIFRGGEYGFANYSAADRCVGQNGCCM